MNKRWVLGAGLLLGCGQKTISPNPSQAKQDDFNSYNPNLVYGKDDRIEAYQVQNQDVRLKIKSTVALIEARNLTSTNTGYQIQAANFGSDYDLCSDEPFREQSTAAFCSGSLVGDDLVMTAGHCITNDRDCANTMIAFDYELTGPGQEARELPDEAVYKCQSIVQREQFNAGRDYGIIRLDRKVTGRKPLELRRSGSPAVGDELYVVGHPAGLPTKLAGGARVRSLKPEYLVANLDTYGGNSGSAVFNAQTGFIEGILVRGDTDFVSRGSCMISNKCSDTGCRGEDVTLASQVLSWVPEIPTDDPLSLPETQTEIFSSNALVSIPDYPGRAVESKISAPSIPGLRSVHVSIDVTHTWIGDLEITVVAPDGSARILHARTGRDQDNIQKTYDVDLNPNQTGLWTLRVQDKARSDVGKLNAWSIAFKSK